MTPDVKYFLKTCLKEAKELEKQEAALKTDKKEANKNASKVLKEYAEMEPSENTAMYEQVLEKIYSLYNEGALDLEQKGHRIAVFIVSVDADRAGKHRRFARAPAPQHIKLPGVGAMGGVLPVQRHVDAADVRREVLFSGYLSREACCTHPEYPPAYARIRCRLPRQRLRRVVSCRPAGCRGWS